MKLNDLSISTKLTTILLVIVLLFVGSGLFAMQRLSALNDVSEEIGTDWLPSIQGLSRQEVLIVQYQMLLFRHFTQENDADMADSEKRLADLQDQIAAARKAYEPLVGVGQERQYFDQAGELLTKYYGEVAKVMALSRNHQKSEATQIVGGATREVFYALRGVLTKSMELNASGSAKAVERARTVYGWSRLLLILGIAVVAVIAALGGLALRRGIVVPVLDMTQAMRRLAEGDHQVTIPAEGRGDEIGHMASAVKVFRDNALRADELAREQENQRQVRENRSRRVDELTGSFDQQVTGVLDVVGTAARLMEETAQSMSASAEQTSRQVDVVVSATDMAAASVQTVAAAAEELSSSISEIGRQVEHSSKLSQSAAEEAEMTNETVRGLSESSARIGDVVNLITSIASQTNLLALNATIEAARAGDAGKGFAVVANEVKSLANQTSRATDEIAQQISAVQAASGQVVSAITGVVTRIGEINQIAAAIAAAVEEQSAATAEIARNVQQAATGTQQVSSNITSVNSAAEESGRSARQVLESAESLAREASHLGTLVGGFLGDVRRA